MLDPFNNRELVDQIRNKNITAFAMEWMPRITRAQSMDVLSSQSNLAVTRLLSKHPIVLIRQCQ